MKKFYINVEYDILYGNYLQFAEIIEYNKQVDMRKEDGNNGVSEL